MDTTTYIYLINLYKYIYAPARAGGQFAGAKNTRIGAI